jgi:Flp pilus assembly protein TadD
MASYALNHQISGLDPWSYHLVNVLLFGGTAALVVRVGRLWGLPALGAGLAGLLFALHPIHVEVVAPAFGRKDILATFFVLAMVLLHRPALDRGGWRMALPVVAYAGAMLSKEVGVVGLVLVAGQDWFLARSRQEFFGEGRRPVLFVAYVGALLVYVLARNAVTGGVGVPDTFYMDNPLVVAPLGTRILTSVALVGKGLGLQLLPLTLSPDYSFNAIPLVESPLHLGFLATVALLAGLGAALIRWGSRIPLLPLATLWYLVALLPTANLLVLVGTIFGERLLFLPSVAFCLAAGGAGAWLMGKGPKLAGLLLALWVGGLAFQTLQYTGAWKTDLTLFERAVATVPNSTKANHKYGEELLRAGQVGPSLPYLRKALEIAPDNQFAAQTLGQAQEWAAQLYLPSDPGGAPPTPPPADAEILYALGQVSLERQALEAAAGYWEAALEVDAQHVASRADLGVVRLMLGDTIQALDHLKRAVDEDPGLASAWFSLGRIYLARGETLNAKEALRAFIQSAGTRFPQETAWARGVLIQLP